MTVEELVVKISASTSQFTNSMKTVNTQLETAGTTGQSSTSKLKAGFKAAATGIAAAAAAATACATAVYKFVDSYADAGDEIDKNSQKLGVNAEQYQTLQYASKLCGLSTSAYTKAVKKVQASGFDGTLYDWLNNLMQVKDQTERNKIAHETLGDSVANSLAPFINGEKTLDDYRGELEQTGGMMSNSAVKSCADLKDKETELNTAISGVRNELAEKFLPAVSDVVDTVTNFIESGGLDSLLDTINQLTPVVVGLVAAFVAYKAALGITALINAVTVAMAAYQSGTTLAAAAQAGLNTIMMLNPIALVVAAIVGLIAILAVLFVKNKAFHDAVIKVWNAIKTAAVTVFNGIKSVISTVWNTIKAVAIPFWNLMKARITLTFNIIKTVAKVAWAGIKNFIINPIKTAYTTVVSVVGKIKTTISNIFNGIKSTVGRIWNGIKTAITNPIQTAKNTISNIVNTIKGIINKCKIKFPSIKLPHFSVSGGTAPWGLFGKGKTPSFSLKWYAQGGVFDKPSVIGVGENGTEAVMPLENNTEWIDVLASKLNRSAMGGGSGTGGKYEFVINIGGTKFGNVCIDSINDAMNQSGQILLNI